MISKTIIVLWSLYCGWGLLSGVSRLDTGMLDNTAYLLGASIGMMSWLVLWAVVVAPVALIAIVFRRPANNPHRRTEPSENWDGTWR